jgi:hypothetical protein
MSNKNLGFLTLSVFNEVTNSIFVGSIIVDLEPILCGRHPHTLELPEVLENTFASNKIYEYVYSMFKDVGLSPVEFHNIKSCMYSEKEHTAWETTPPIEVISNKEVLYGLYKSTDASDYEGGSSSSTNLIMVGTDPEKLVKSYNSEIDVLHLIHSIEHSSYSRGIPDRLVIDKDSEFSGNTGGGYQSVRHRVFVRQLKDTDSVKQVMAILKRG